MCDQVALLLSKIDRPHESCSWRNCRFYCSHKLIPLCRAIIAVLDEKDSWNDRENLEEIDPWSPTQSLVLVRNSDGSNLSTPISFSGIEKRSLPLSQNDLEAKAEGIDVIRVTLSVAVRFIAELEERENAAFLELGNNELVGILTFGLVRATSALTSFGALLKICFTRGIYNATFN
jgi:hypothetical protein